MPATPDRREVPLRDTTIGEVVGSTLRLENDCVRIRDLREAPPERAEARRHTRTIACTWRARADGSARSGAATA